MTNQKYAPWSVDYAERVPEKLVDACAAGGAGIVAALPVDDVIVHLIHRVHEGVVQLDTRFGHPVERDIPMRVVIPQPPTVRAESYG